MSGSFRRQALIVTGVLLLAFGAYGFFIHKQDANFANDLITLCGLPVAIIGLYYVPLFTPKAGRPQDKTEIFSAPTGPAGALRGIFAQVADGAAGAYRATPPSATVPVPGVPVSYGLAFFASGGLNFVGSFILLDSNLASHRLQYIQHVVDKCAVVMVASAILLVMGLPGFHALQAARARYSSMLGCIALAASSVTYSMLLWGLASGGVAQALRSDQPISDLTHLLTFVAAILLAISILRGRVYPRWTAYVMMLNAILAFSWLGGSSETAGTISLLISLLNSFMMMVFAWHMVRWRLPAVAGLGRA